MTQNGLVSAQVTLQVGKTRGQPRQYRHDCGRYAALWLGVDRTAIAQPGVQHGVSQAPAHRHLSIVEWSCCGAYG
jgi:hypothetical protein